MNSVLSYFLNNTVVDGEEGPKEINEIKRKAGQQCNNNRLSELGLWEVEAKKRCWPPTMSEAKRANSEKGSKSEKFTKLKEVLCGEL